MIFIHSSKYDSFCYFNSLLVNLHAPNSHIVQQTPCHGRWAGSLPFFGNLLENSWILKRKGFFHLAQNSGNFLLVHQMEQTVSVWFNWNIRDQLWRWSSLTGLVILVSWTEMSLSFLTKYCCPLLTRTITKSAEK